MGNGFRWQEADQDRGGSVTTRRSAAASERVDAPVGAIGAGDEVRVAGAWAPPAKAAAGRLEAGAGIGLGGGRLRPRGLPQAAALWRGSRPWAQTPEPGRPPSSVPNQRSPKRSAGGPPPPPPRRPAPVRP